MEKIPIMTVPFEKITIDLVGPFQRSKLGYKYFLTVIDLASWYCLASMRESTVPDLP